MKNITWRSVSLEMEMGCDGMMLGLCTTGLVEGPLPYANLGDLRIAIEDELNGSDGGIKPRIQKVIFNDPATIILWTDGSKTVVKCQPGDIYDREKGFAMAYLKKLLGNDNTFNKEINKWVSDDDCITLYASSTVFKDLMQTRIAELCRLKQDSCDICEGADDLIGKKTISRNKGKRHKFKYCPACGRKLKTDKE